MNPDENLSEKPPATGASRRTPWWKTALKISGIVLCPLVAFGAYLWFFQQLQHSPEWRPAKAIPATEDKILDAIRRGSDYCERHQESNGHFSKGWLDPKPGFTALVVDALARSPEKYREKDHEFLRKAAKAIISHQYEDGSMCTPGMGVATYTTAMSVMALTGLENPEYKPAIDKGVAYLRSVQYADDEISPNAGGIGYGVNGKTSGDVAAMWVEALKSAGVKEGDPAFKNAEKFFSRLQNTESNDRKEFNGKQIGNDGGFFYRPGQSSAPDEIKNGVHILRSYGLMSYAGLKSFMYMKIPKDDARVQSAFTWVKNNYTLDENRNIGADGLFNYYQTMAKALSIYGERILVTPDGKSHDWAKELSDKIISLQDVDGSWHNKDSSRWMENDAVMVTAFAIRTLSVCHDFMKEHPAK